MEFFFYLLLILAGVHLYRYYWMNKELDRLHFADFDGDIYSVGDTVIAVQKPEGEPTKSIICVPGFLEDMRYFLDVYRDQGYELILINNAQYHSPFSLRQVRQLSWPSNPFKVGTIEHDGFYVAQAIKDLASTEDIVLHGHSRGGAVMLDAGRQFPELMANVSALLEAPVLPQAKPATKGNETVVKWVFAYMIPLVFPTMRKISTKQLLRNPMMHPYNDLKVGLLKSLFSTQQNYAVCVENVTNIADWQKKNFYDVYNHIKNITVLMGERDHVLSNKAMLASAQQDGKINVVQTAKTNHFISLEQPHYVQQAVAQIGGGAEVVSA